MADFAEAVLHLQAYQKIKSDTNWKEIQHVLQCYHTVQEYSEENEVLKQLCNNIFDEEFLKILSDHLVKIETIDKNTVNCINQILLKFDVVSRERRIVENCLKELFNDLTIENVVQKKKFDRFELAENFITNKPELQPNLVKGSYENMEEYLTIQRNLIIEDFLRPLRQGIIDIKTQIKKSNSQDLHFYGKPIIVNHYQDKLTIRLEQVSSRIDWSTTSRLIFGSLVLLFSPAGNSFTFWTVQEKTFQSRTLELTLISANPTQLLQDENNLEVYESMVYYEAYKHVIQAMTTMKKLPFGETLFKTCDDPTGNFVKQHEGSIDFPVNESQLRAIKLGLENKIALIQGPPGTGKSYVGTMLAKTLIPKQNKPVVIICYTNHALDHFLESLIGFTDKIIRIGSRSKSSQLDKYNLTGLKKSLADTGSRDKRIYKAVMALYQHLKQDLNLEEYLQANKAIKDWNDIESLQILSKADVIGLTTTGAAKNFQLLRMLNPEIMIFEESGQVLESHVLSSLTPNLKKLILIGDHQQLKPSVSTYALAKNYNLDVSLFERLLNNGFEYVKLLEQHRMRPEISRIVKNEFYPDLQDHFSVHNYPKIKGLEHSLYFLEHFEAEGNLEDSKSKTNQFEAEFLLSLADYLIKQGYEASKITILATYLGQMMLLQKLCQIEGVVISVVDNYQGEENDIILLSLVRSNENASIGYLSIQSRICVALSRAKMGMYIIGNMSDLSKASKMWTSIKNQLMQTNQIGPQLVLQCPFHPESKLNVTKSKDFMEFCQENCGENLMCGHQCDEICHKIDRSHKKEFKCMKPCLKSCTQNHPCSKLCSEPCQPCLVTELKTFSDCGHTGEISCPSNNIPNICKFTTKTKLHCGHIKNTFCGVNETKSQDCHEICQYKLDCGHKCFLNCHEGNSNHNKKCQQTCGKPKKNCSTQAHICQKLCYQPCLDCDETIENYTLSCGHTSDLKCSEVNTYDCMKKCEKMLSCGIHKCKNFCYECKNGKCQPCNITIEKTLDCGHLKSVPCSSSDHMDKCLEPCSKLLDCGHACPLLCYQDCSEAKCEVIIDESGSQSSCGHPRTRKCGADQGQESFSSCMADCEKVLPCTHKCKFKCLDCSYGQLHLPCEDNCVRTLICGHKCQGKCGEACQPCSRLKCLFQSCHHKKCKSTCQDDCSDCKEKCGLSCKHSKCTKKCSIKCNKKTCDEKCDLKLNCGHNCQGFCGEICPQEVCGICKPINFNKEIRYIELPGCKHAVESGKLETIFDDNIIGIPECPNCQIPISYLPRFKEKFKSRKKDVVEVFDHYFNLKSNLNKTKQSIPQDFDLEICEAVFKNHVLTRCQDKSNLMNLSEYQILKTKLILIDHIKSNQHSTMVMNSILAYLNRPNSSLGPDYVKNLQLLLATNFIPKIEASKLKSISSFAKGSWMRSSDSGEIQSVLFLD